MGKYLTAVPAGLPLPGGRQAPLEGRHGARQVPRLRCMVKQAKSRRKTGSRWAEYLNRAVPAVYGPYCDRSWICRMKDLIRGDWLF
jgi:hypothetical protein